MNSRNLPTWTNNKLRTDTAIIDLKILRYYWPEDVLPNRIISNPRLLHRWFTAAFLLGFLPTLHAQRQNSPNHSVQDNAHWVNPLIGSDRSAIGYGGTMPFVTAPFGMTDWTPQTRQNHLGVVSYNFADMTLSGFMGTHQPAIWMGDYASLTLMPEIDSLKLTPASRALPFTHTGEHADPDLYTVTLDAGDHRVIRTAMTATTRCAYLRFSFPANPSSRILIEASRPGVSGYAHVDAVHREITGYNPERTDADLGPLKLPNFKGYFVVQFRTAFSTYGTYGSTPSEPNQPSGAWAGFHTRSGQVVEVRVGISFISVDQARENLHREIPSWDFAATQAALRAEWNRKLSEVSVTGASEDHKYIVYTALYHALLYPRVVSETDARSLSRYYSAFDDTVHTGSSYTAFSIWDTFRAEFSLLTLIAPERIDGMINALMQDYQQGGWMPKWPNPSYTNIMIGTHADSLVAEAMRKGFHGFDSGLAWAAVYKDATVPPEGDTTRRWFDREPHTPYEARGGLAYSKVLGYVPDDKTAESASRTLEDAYDDWCVSLVAARLGKTSDAAYFQDRAHNYANIFNKSTGFMQARNADGSWALPNKGWTEGNRWVYTFAVMQDIGGLMQLMGGPAKYNALLDEHFAGNHNIHKNEPSHHYGYLYDYSGEPWKTQAKVREIASAEYAALPGGLDGDDDCGQMSAWYLFTALGFYPVTPASGDYMIGSPLFASMSLNLANGHRFHVIARNNSASNVYIQSATLNNKQLSKPVVTWEQIQAGGELILSMGARPSSWATDWRPHPLPGSPTGKPSSSF
jgi:predicted alpha-1,2-mannosidase